MNHQSNITNLGAISTLKELRFQKKLLASRVEHQEALIVYKMKVIREQVTPGKLLYKGIESISSRSPFMNIAFRFFTLVRRVLTEK